MAEDPVQVPASLQVRDTESMEALGERLAQRLAAGDVVCLSGPLGAGKTALTRGIGRGLGCATPVSSPTFVIARRHRGTRADLLHCDAYRVGSAVEFSDLDLDIEGAIVVVEWGDDMVAELSDSWLQVHIDREPGSDADGPTTELEGGEGLRRVDIVGHGPQWPSATVATLVEEVGR